MERLEQIPARPLSDWMFPVTLTGRSVRLGPLTEQHAEGLARHADADTVAWLSRGGPAEQSVQGWADHIRLGAGRVHFKVDARNARSRAAMLKLGATQEGTLRRYQVRPDGTARDSVMFSVLLEEWPAVGARLRQRLNTLG